MLLNKAEQHVLGTIALDPLTIDQSIVSTGLTTVLHIRRLVKRLSGNLVARP